MRLAPISKIQTTDDIHDALGFTGEPNKNNLIALYNAALKKDSDYTKGDLRIAWKIAQDPYYWNAFKHYKSLETIENAGFFDDGLTPGTLESLKDVNILSTPLGHIQNQIKALKDNHISPQKQLVVLMTSGCFAPVHDGHVAMMETAKKTLEENGYHVLGGFFSPAHDDYVSTKGDDARRLTAAHRIMLLDKVLQDTPWLNVDPWAARYTPTDINFTDTCERMKDYLHAHINSDVPIEVAYVCGADNIAFTQSFVSKGLSVCVKRPGYSADFNQIISDMGLNNNERILFSQTKGVEASSSDVRNGRMKANKIFEQDPHYQELLNGIPRYRQAGFTPETDNYLIRNDLYWATRPWRGQINDKALDMALETFKKGLVRALENAFERSNTPGYPDHIKALLLSAKDQQKIVDQIMHENPNRVLNNDLLTSGTDQLINVSRFFELSAPQLRSDLLQSRAKSTQDIKRLPKGDYIFIDDDIATGSTKRMIQQGLPKGVHISQSVSLAEQVFKMNHPNKDFYFWDIIDARDFLFGSRDSGLVTKDFNGSSCRAPYILPYVSVINRCKIPPDQEQSFTKDIIALNDRFFKDIWMDLKLANTDPQFSTLMKSIGFKHDTRMQDITTWHLKFNP